MSPLKKGAWLAFALALAGCGDGALGLVLVFPSDLDRMNAASANIKVTTPPNGGDECPAFTAPTPSEPTRIDDQETVTLTNGVANKSLNIPTGRRTILVNVQNAGGTLFLRGCKTDNVSAGATVEVRLQAIGVQPDMTTPVNDGSVDDLLPPPPDMTQRRTLSITATELRAPSRRLTGVNIVVSDAMGANLSGMTDANGNLRLDTIGMTAPFQVMATAPAAGGYSGGVTLFGMTPSFTNDVVNMTLPIELDPPATAVANKIDVSVGTAAAGDSFDIYYVPTFGVLADQQKKTLFPGNGTLAVTDLIANGGYRIAVVRTLTVANQISTPPALHTAGNPYNPTLASFVSYTNSLQTTVTSNPTYTTQKYRALLVVPASATQAVIPLGVDQTFTTNMTMAARITPAMPSTVQSSAVVMTEVTGDGTNVHAELRHQLTPPIGATDSFGTAVPDPPVVSVVPSPSPTPTPSPFPATMPVMISATPPSSFPISSSFIHITFVDSNDKFHWHVVAPISTPTNFTLAGMVLPAGIYTVTISFGQNFTLPDGTVQATLQDDYTKLTRPLPAQLSQRKLVLTVN